MYKSFRVKNFRCFKDLTVEPLERVNLFAGKNNVGKTALLEALMLFCQARSPYTPGWMAHQRGLTALWPKEFFRSLFRGFDQSQTIEFSGIRDDERDERLTIRVHEPRFQPLPEATARPDSVNAPIPDDAQRIRSRPRELGFPSLELECSYALGNGLPQSFSGGVYQEGVYLDDPPPMETPLAGWLGPDSIKGSETVYAERLSEYQEAGEDKKVISMLRVIDPRLTALKILMKGKEPVIYGDIGRDRPMPLRLLGQGMARVLEIALHLGASPFRVMLIDEIENGLHHSVMEQIWTALGKAAAENDVQVFATTHSMECIAAAHAAFTKTGRHDFLLHRLETIDGEASCVTLTEESLDFAIEDGWEIR